MSLAEFENLVERYLDGTLSSVDEVRLMQLIQKSPELKSRFKAQVRLEQAQLKYLQTSKSSRPKLSHAWLKVFVNRMTRVSAYACLLAFVFVQWHVTLPSEYGGVLFTTTNSDNEVASDIEEFFTMEGIMANAEIDEMSDMNMPEMETNELPSPLDEMGSTEV